LTPGTVVSAVDPLQLILPRERLLQTLERPAGTLFYASGFDRVNRLNSSHGNRF